MQVTKCNDCLFKKMDGNVQVGCNVRDLPEDQYFLTPEVNGEQCWAVHRYCHFKRDLNWALRSLEQDIEIKYITIIKWTNRQALENTLNSLMSYNDKKLKPGKVIVVCYQQYDDEAVKALQEIPHDFEWSVTTILADLPDWRDEILHQHKSQFYMFVDDTLNTSASRFMLELNRRIHWEDLRFGAIQAKDFLLIPHGVYTMVIKPLRKILEEMDQTGLKTLDENFNTIE